MMTIGGGAHEAPSLVPRQNLGLGGTLWSVPPQNFCRQMLTPVMAKIVVLDAFCLIKNT